MVIICILWITQYASKLLELHFKYYARPGLFNNNMVSPNLVKVI